MTIRDAIRRDHRKLWGYPSLLLAVWALSLVLMSGGAWFVQEWRYRDLAQRSSADPEADRPVYLSTGQLQVVSGQDVRVYMTSDDDAGADYATQERRWREQHPFQNSVRTHATRPAVSWDSSGPGRRPDIGPLR